MEPKPCIVVHHGGCWKSNCGSMEYEGGSTTIFNDLAEDLDALYLKKLVLNLGYTNLSKLHYLDPRKTMVDGIRFLGYDHATFDPFVSLLLEYSLIHVYCEHNLNNNHEPCYIVDLGNYFHDEIYANTSTMTFTELLQHDNEDDNDFENHITPILDDGIDYDEDGSDMDDEEVVDAIEKVKQAKKTERDYEEELKQLERVAQNKRKQPDDLDSEYEDSTDLDSPDEASDEEDWTTPQETVFYVGQEFDNAEQLRKAITDYSIFHGRDVHLSTNKKNRIGADCKVQGCKWRIWASWATGKRTFQIKTHHAEHICGRKNKVTMISSSWVASTYAMEHVWCDWGLKISIWLAVKARKKGQAMILGEYREQYGLLHRYALEIFKANSNNTVVLKLDNGEFQRVYFCFEALRKGFLAGCRPFISLDGCFLKGPFGGQLLVAVGRNGNNQMFPIAWAVVEVESGDSWGWFLELLAQDLGTNDGAGYTLMGVFGGGQELRKWFWRIAKSTTENVFRENIEAFKKVFDAAANDLLKRNYSKWCRAFYTPQSCCDNIDNNMSEVFNAYILNSRHKPIITMLEDIRESIMERLFKKRDFISKKECFICPRIQKKLEENKLKSRGWSAFWDGRFKFGVREGIDQTKYVIDLRDRTCSCNAWQLSGVPCKHAIAAIWKSVEHPEQYVASCFTKLEYLKAYDYPL
ncbi:uncharacterized protein [Spinacia oleracea]|uniref:SWIM-type domain-containing protein n=1 Tax=Spinacia oleracea TaxID=3562 RepID=A0ABM3RQ76_SPIOL|nr:uncharacterized protein LOC130471586 [Spinacia oleracea]